MDPVFNACESAWLDGGGGRWDDEDELDEDGEPIRRGPDSYEDDWRFDSMPHPQHTTGG